MPVHSSFEGRRVKCGWEHRRRQRVPDFGSAHNKSGGEALSTTHRDANQVRIVRRSTSASPVVKGSWWDQVVELLRTLTEVQSVENRQAGNITPVS